MAIFNGTLRVRRGLESDFDESKMVSGELAIATDKPVIWFCWKDGTAAKIEGTVTSETLKKYFDEWNGGSTILVDETLSKTGQAADSKVTGDKFDKLASDIENIGNPTEEQISNAVNSYMDNNPITITETDPTVPDWAKNPTKPTYTASEVGALPNTTKIPSKTSDLQNDSGFLTQHQDLSGYALKSEIPNIPSDIGAESEGTAESKVSDHDVSDTAHNDIRLLVQGLAERLNALADSDDTTLDQMSEVVAYIKSNKSLIDAITTSKINVSDIIDNLTTNVSNKPLSAAQGVALKALIDGITIPEKLPNPQKLTFSGAVTAEYDGSKPVSVEIPSGGGSTSGNSKYSLISEVVTEELLNRIVIEIPSNINELFAYVKVPASSDKNAIYATAWSNDIAMSGGVGEVGVDTLDTNEYYIKMHFLKLGNYRLCDYASKAYYPPSSVKFYAGGKVGEITGNYYIFGIQYANITLPVGTEIKLYGR